jgi:hypothetical protein
MIGLGAALCGSLLFSYAGGVAQASENGSKIKFNATSVFGQQPITSCPNTPPHYTVVRIRIPGSIHKIFYQKLRTQVRYTTYVSTQDEDAAGYDDPNGKDESSASVSDNPYHSDLSNKGLQGKTVKYIVILTSPKAKMKFLKTDPETGSVINGIVAAPPPANAVSKIVCVEDLSHNDRVATFYFQNGSSGYVASGFNIVLVPSAYGKDTPIIIDPKIMNNGY